MTSIQNRSAKTSLTDNNMNYKETHQQQQEPYSTRFHHDNTTAHTNCTYNNDDNDDDSFQDAVATSGALVGENILDSPGNNNHRRNRVAPDPLFLQEPDEHSVGLVAQGLAWVQRQRQQRRRLYLQNQAEQQLQKLQQAQEQESQQDPSTATPIFSLLDNPTFQSLIGGGVSQEAEPRPSLLDVLTSSMDTTRDPYPSDMYTISASGSGYSVNIAVPTLNENDNYDTMLPVRIVAEPDTAVPRILNNPALLQNIARHVLPRRIQDCQWTRAYSLARDGDSFDQCLRCVSGYKQTLLVLKTSRDKILGGFADTAWQGASGSCCYYGGTDACLFRVVSTNTTDNEEDNDTNTDSVVVYPWTGANRYIQLVDLSRKMLAFGGGGCDGAFGLCIEQDFQLGSTGPCATFDNEPLCDQENFSIVDMEIYGFLTGQF
jgi:hypothetical protein